MSVARLKEIYPELISPYDFYYAFNHPQAVVDPDYWTPGGDAGGFTVDVVDDEPPSRKLFTPATTNNKYYIHGDAKFSKLWNFQASAYDVITVEIRLKANTNLDTQALWGLFEAGSFPADYAEPAVDCAHFFLDDGISANFVCRTYDAAEEQTASNIALDTAYHTFKTVWGSGQVTFLIDEVFKARHTAQIPDSPMGLVILIKTQADAEKSLDLEYIKVNVK